MFIRDSTKGWLRFGVTLFGVQRPMDCTDSICIKLLVTIGDTVKQDVLFARIVLWFLTVAMALIAAGMTAPGWAGLFAVAAFSTLVYSFCLQRKCLMLISGILVPISLLARTFFLISTASTLTAPLAVVGVFLFAGVSAVYMWQHIFSPLSGLLKKG